MPLISPADSKAAEQSGPDNTKGDLRCSHQNEGRLRRIRRADVDAYLEEQLRFQAVQSSREVNMPRDDYKQSANTLLDGRISLAQVINNGIEPPDELEPGVLLQGRAHAIFSGPGEGKTICQIGLIKRAIERGKKIALF